MTTNFRPKLQQEVKARSGRLRAAALDLHLRHRLSSLAGCTITTAFNPIMQMKSILKGRSRECQRRGGK